MNAGTDDDEAARWAILRDTASLDEGDERALEAWLSGDERRHGALLRAEATLAYLDRGRALSHPEEVAPRAWLNRRTMLVSSALAGVAAAAGGLLLPGVHAERINTALGEVRRIPLADGSIASLNTATRVTVQMQPEQRRIVLEDGEAWFQVAHDRLRPFLVEVGDVRVQAIGTAFSVRRRESGADIVVTEGVIETWVAGHENVRTRIVAGAKAFVSGALHSDGMTPQVKVVSAPDSDRAVAWRNGDLILNGESLSYAAAEINRYNRRKLVIDDPALGREPLVGYFRTNEPENFAQAVASMVGGRVFADADSIRLKRQRR